MLSSPAGEDKNVPFPDALFDLLYTPEGTCCFLVLSFSDLAEL
jgi:hypothetical protein